MTPVPKASILVVDDEEVTRQLLADFLTELGYRVQTVASGEEGLQAARSTSFDLIITDMRMPGMSGIQLMHSIREINIDTAFISTLISFSKCLRSSAFPFGSFFIDHQVFNLLRVLSNKESLSKAPNVSRSALNCSGEIEVLHVTLTGLREAGTGGDTLEDNVLCLALS